MEPWSRSDYTLLITDDDKKDAGIYGNRKIIRYNKVRETSCMAIRVMMFSAGVDAKHFRVRP